MTQNVGTEGANIKEEVVWQQKKCFPILKPTHLDSGLESEGCDGDGPVVPEDDHA